MKRSFRMRVHDSRGVRRRDCIQGEGSESRVVKMIRMVGTWSQASYEKKKLELCRLENVGMVEWHEGSSQLFRSRREWQGSFGPDSFPGERGCCWEESGDSRLLRTGVVVAAEHRFPPRPLKERNIMPFMANGCTWCTCILSSDMLSFSYR
jgi:hypothetical protein